MTRDFENWLMCIPMGWEKAFGEELYNELYAIDPELAILDMKEKWGALDIYFLPSDYKLWDKIDAVCMKYHDISTKTCAICGKPGRTTNSHGWLMPLCKKCI